MSKPNRIGKLIFISARSGTNEIFKTSRKLTDAVFTRYLLVLAAGDQVKFVIFSSHPNDMEALSQPSQRENKKLIQ